MCSASCRRRALSCPSTEAGRARSIRAPRLCGCDASGAGRSTGHRPTASVTARTTWRSGDGCRAASVLPRHRMPCTQRAGKPQMRDPSQRTCCQGCGAGVPLARMARCPRTCAARQPVVRVVSCDDGPERRPHRAVVRRRDARERQPAGTVPVVPRQEVSRAGAWASRVGQARRDARGEHRGRRCASLCAKPATTRRGGRAGSIPAGLAGHPRAYHRVNAWPQRA